MNRRSIATKSLTQLVVFMRYTLGFRVGEIQEIIRKALVRVAETEEEKKDV